MSMYQRLLMNNTPFFFSRRLLQVFAFVPRGANSLRTPSQYINERQTLPKSPASLLKASRPRASAPASTALHPSSTVCLRNGIVLSYTVPNACRRERADQKDTNDRTGSTPNPHTYMVYNRVRSSLFRNRFPSLYSSIFFTNESF